MEIKKSGPLYIYQIDIAQGTEFLICHAVYTNINIFRHLSLS